MIRSLTVLAWVADAAIAIDRLLAHRRHAHFPSGLASLASLLQIAGILGLLWTITRTRRLRSAALPRAFVTVLVLLAIVIVVGRAPGLTGASLETVSDLSACVSAVSMTVLSALIVRRAAGNGSNGDETR